MAPGYQDNLFKMVRSHQYQLLLVPLTRAKGVCGMVCLAGCGAPADADVTGALPFLTLHHASQQGRGLGAGAH